MYYARHAHNYMAHQYTRSKTLCSHDSCMKPPTFNIEGKKAVYCKQHAQDGMADVRGRRGYHNSCTELPTFNADGSKTEAYRKQHAGDDLVNVRDKNFSH